MIKMELSTPFHWCDTCPAFDPTVDHQDAFANDKVMYRSITIRCLYEQQCSYCEKARTEEDHGKTEGEH